MNRSIVAGAALLAGIALAAPMFAWSADPPAAEQSGQNQPATGGPGMMGGMPGRFGRGPMEHAGGMREMMMHHMMHMMQLSPDQRCEERLARHAAMVAYTVTKLNLTGQQRPLWDKVNAVIEAGIAKQQQLCATLKSAAGGQQTILERLDRTEQFLSNRLQTLQQVRPALQQLYQALTPDQQAIINHPFRHRS